MMKAIDHIKYKNINYLKINVILTPSGHPLTLHLGLSDLPGRKPGPTGRDKASFLPGRTQNPARLPPRRTGFRQQFKQIIF